MRLVLPPVCCMLVVTPLEGTGNAVASDLIMNSGVDELPMFTTVGEMSIIVALGTLALTWIPCRMGTTSSADCTKAV